MGKVADRGGCVSSGAWGARLCPQRSRVEIVAPERGLFELFRDVFRTIYRDVGPCVGSIQGAVLHSLMRLWRRDIKHSPGQRIAVDGP